MSDVCELLKKCNLRLDNGACTIGVVCQPILEECVGCSRVDNGYCHAYINPKAKWVPGRECPLASHTLAKKVESSKLRVGQQKQKKKTRK